MKPLATVRPLWRLLAWMAAALLSGMLPMAQAETPSGPAIYQQRGPDGKIVFTDRPSPRATTERTWRFDPEDPQAVEAAEARRDAGRVEAAQVNERFQRSLEQQQRRELEMEIERLRLSQTQAVIDLERERAAMQEPVYVDPFWPDRRGWRGSRAHRSPQDFTDDRIMTKRPKQKPASLRK